MASIALLKSFAVLFAAAIAVSAAGVLLSWHGTARLARPLRLRRAAFVGCLPFAFLGHLALMLFIIPLLTGTDAFGNTRIRAGYSLHGAEGGYLLTDGEGAILAEGVVRLVRDGAILYGVDARGLFALNTATRQLSRAPRGPASLPKLLPVEHFGRPSIFHVAVSLLLILGLPLLVVPVLWRRWCVGWPLGACLSAPSAGPGLSRSPES